ncbi:efflux RND transporter periplasmic adaptor subunit [Erythrobacter crassostreae]|uniref:Efflux RND transporter periplasmic adaptor subunit n=1 Tax=Erythrobacter crassostreae TaxID=2828328 RepID=A0A9X1JLU8_9SPHN|nr:efflux RND transporter periplasmic adaptor subunit [Erythrobacter crassostrea]MBV7260396.1 efflux RND transporter periplasmic adaptor subunit [Erythrobacter crassostrea]
MIELLTRRGNRWAIAAALFAFLTLSVWYSFGAGQTAQPDEKPATPVAVDIVQEQSEYTVSRTFAGRLRASNVTDLSFELPGRINRLYVEAGDRVSRGAPLARVDIDELISQQSELSAVLQEAEARLLQTSARFQRIEALDPRFVTLQQLDDARADRDSAKARVDQATGALRRLETNQRNSLLVAPFSGEIVSRSADAGSVVGAGQTVFRLSGGGPMEADVGVPARFRDQVRLGSEYRITNGERETIAIAKRIVDDINPRTNTLTVRFVLPESTGFVVAETVRLTLQETLETKGMWVKNSALVESLRGLWAVYVVSPDSDQDDDSSGALTGIVKRQDVEVIHSEADRSFVRGALTNGSLVIRDSPFRFVPGQRVLVKDTNGPEHTSQGKLAESGAASQ